MTFFNKKEEVIDIELTPYGKYLLSKGRWKPAYYEFYDDDVIYDSQYSGNTEKQELIQPRISETPRIKTQYTFEGAETRYKNYTKQILENRSDLQEALDNTLEKRRDLVLSSLPLANSSISNEKAPAWSVNLLKGTIENISSSVNIVGLPNNLYTLNLETVNYKLASKKRDTQISSPNIEDNEQIGASSDLGALSRTFDDDSYIEVREDYLLLYLKEENVDLLKENFDITIYEIETNPETGEEIEKPLLFKKEKEKIVNNILLDETEEEPEGYMGPKYVSHYFNIYADKEIDSDLLSGFLDEKEKKMLSIVDGYVFREDSLDVQVLASPQIESISEEEIKDFEDCD